MLKIILMSLSVLGLMACATMQLPAGRLESLEASIRSAEEVGALGVPAAKLHLQLAKDQSDTAKKMAVSGDQRSLLVLARAESDAELALALAREADVHKDSLAAGEDLEAVRARGNP